MKQLAITLRLLQHKLREQHLGNESALVGRMAHDAESMSHINIAEELKPAPEPEDAGAKKRSAKKDAE